MDVASMSGSAVNQGLIGMQRSQLEITRSAQQIASAGITGQDNSTGNDNDIVGSIINIKAQTQIFDASAKLIKSADETVGTLLRAKA